MFKLHARTVYGSGDEPRRRLREPDGVSREPEVALARNHGFLQKHLRRIRALIDERKSEIRDAWDRHFER